MGWEKVVGGGAGGGEESGLHNVNYDFEYGISI